MENIDIFLTNTIKMMNFHDYVSLAKIAKCILSSYQKELMQHLRQQHMDEVRRVIDLTSNVRKDGKL